MIADDPLAPFLRRIEQMKLDAASIATGLVAAVKLSDATDAEIEEFQTAMEAARRANNYAYEISIKVAEKHSRLSTDLNKMTEAVSLAERLADTEQIMRQITPLLLRDEMLFARIVINLPADMFELAVQEIQSYQTGPAQLERLRAAIEQQGI
jgi:hypothetical protein